MSLADGQPSKPTWLATSKDKNMVLPPSKFREFDLRCSQRAAKSSEEQHIINCTPFKYREKQHSLFPSFLLKRCTSRGLVGANTGAKGEANVHNSQRTTKDIEPGQ
jgi:hypothetical protein